MYRKILTDAAKRMADHKLNWNVIVSTVDVINHYNIIRYMRN